MVFRVGGGEIFKTRGNGRVFFIEGGGVNF